MLAKGFVAHVGFNHNDQPVVIPLVYQYDPSTPDKLYLHGSHASRTLKHLATGAPVCVTVTTIQGLVYSRTAEYHSMNYESVICFGTARIIKNLAEKAAVFERQISRYHPGRTPGHDYEAVTERELKAAALVEVHLDDTSATARRGGPLGPRDHDPNAPGTSGVLPL